MKNMRFLQPHRDQGRFPIRLRHALPIAVLLVLVWASPRWLEKSIFSLGTPLFTLRTALAEGTVSLTNRFIRRDELLAENERLREENARLSLKGALYDELHATVVRLETLLLRTPEDGAPILAHVIASPAGSPYDSFVIDVGLSDGVSVGDQVIYDETIVLGSVTLATEHASRVALLSSPGTMIEASIGTNASVVTVEGRGGGMFVMKLPKDAVVSAHDAIVPRGDTKALGFVAQTESNDSDAFQTVYAVMPINLFETREVLVLRGDDTIHE